MSFSIVLALLVFGVMASGLARWIGKFIDAVSQGGTAWVQPVMVLASAVVIGFLFGLGQTPAASLPLCLAYVFGTLALIQYGYELVVKPVLALATLVIAVFSWCTTKLTPCATLAAETVPPDVIAGSSDTLAADTAALTAAQATLAAAQATLKAAQATYATTATADNAAAVAAAQKNVDTAQAAETVAQAKLDADSK